MGKIKRVRHKKYAKKTTNIKKDWLVYLLKNTHNRYTYLGVTNNSKQRIRKHNGEIKGGAKYTKMKKGRGKWIYHVKVSNLTKSESLSIERTAKNKRKRAKGKTPLKKRMSVLLPLFGKYKDIKLEYSP